MRTGRGLAYVQHVLESDFMGSFVRVLPGFYDEPADESVVRGASSLTVGYPLASAVKAGLVQQVFSADIPDEYRAFPVMRAGDTWLWADGEDYRVDSLSPEHRAAPFRAVVSHDLLVAYIENEVRNEEIDDYGTVMRELPGSREVEQPSSDASAQHFLYFPDERQARRARRRLARLGFMSEHSPAADGDEWILRVDTKDDDDLEVESHILEEVAEGAGGEYDGTELRVR